MRNALKNRMMILLTYRDEFDKVSAGKISTKVNNISDNILYIYVYIANIIPSIVNNIYAYLVIYSVFLRLRRKSFRKQSVLFFFYLETQ